MIATHELISHVAAHAGVAPDHAERAARVVLSGLGAYLGAAHRELVADELPPALAAALLAGNRRARPIDERLLAPGITAGRARELIASVCRVLVEELSDEAVRVIRDAAPPDLARLFEPPAPELPPRAAASARSSTLAAGDPRSRHPVSEASPPHEQTDSIAAANPHAGTKLSSAAELPQEHRHTTLAEGHPGALRSISSPRR